MITKITVDNKEGIVDFITNLDNTQNIDVIRGIYYLFKNNNVKMQPRKYGYLIMVSDILPDTLIELVQFINFTITNNRVIKERQMNLAINLAASQKQQSDDDDDNVSDDDDDNTSNNDSDNASDNNDNDNDLEDTKVVYNLKRKRMTFNRGLSQLLKDCRGNHYKSDLI